MLKVIEVKWSSDGQHLLRLDELNDGTHQLNVLKLADRNQLVAYKSLSSRAIDEYASCASKRNSEGSMGSDASESSVISDQQLRNTFLSCDIALWQSDGVHLLAIAFAAHLVDERRRVFTWLPEISCDYLIDITDRLDLSGVNVSKRVISLLLINATRTAGIHLVA